MSWDLFSAAEAARRSASPRERAFNETDNEALARAVAARQADGASDGVAEPSRVRRGEWSVADVNHAARELVEGMMPPLRVVGEVTNFTRARSGHCYFSLRDAEAQLRCVMWREEARRLPTSPAEGMQVRALGRLTIYPARGEFQLVVSELDARGDGLWKLAFDRLRGRLDAEGLTAPERKRPLPRHPARIGIVTSPAGAALHDIVTVLRRRAPWVQVVLCGCRVQGDGAAAEIAAAIRSFARAGCADLLIVGRGGGSREDLWAFNEEAVARALAESPIPTISAVGHETDVTIADLVADLRAPTPSAAAEAAVPDGATLRRELATTADRLAAAADQRSRAARGAVEQVRVGLAAAQQQRIRGERLALGGLAGRLNALSPLAALQRGFAVPTDTAGRVLRTTHDFAVGAAFNLRVADGVVACRVEATHPGAESITPQRSEE